MERFWRPQKERELLSDRHIRVEEDSGGRCKMWEGKLDK